MPFSSFFQSSTKYLICCILLLNLFTGTAFNIRSGTSAAKVDSTTVEGGIAHRSMVAEVIPPTWERLGASQLNDAVLCMIIFSGDLYVGGRFTNAGGDANADYLARWDGSAWHALGTTPLNGPVYDLVLYNGGLVAGGSFTDAGGVTQADDVAAWDGATWSALADGLGYYVTSLAVVGTDLYAGGTFSLPNEVPINYLAKWDGNAWLGIGGLDAPVWALAASGSNLYVGGEFINAGGDDDADHIARWNGTYWTAIDPDCEAIFTSGRCIKDTVRAIAVSGSHIFIGGDFTNDNPAKSYLLEWNGTAWMPLGAGIFDDAVTSLTLDGSNLYVGGYFSYAGGLVGTRHVALWNGSSWSSLGGGVSGSSLTSINDILVTGGTVLIAGNFTNAGRFGGADFIARLAPQRLGWFIPITVR